MDNVKIVDVNEKNINEYPPRCFLKTDNIGYKKKYDWLIKRFSEGLKIKNLYVEGEKNCNGFIEYIAGENAWRSVDAKDFMFIHCIWISPNKYKNLGYASLLVNECIKDAEHEEKVGVAVITSEGPFMAGKNLFLKNDFEIVDSVEPSYNLMVKTFKKGPIPKFNDWESSIAKYQGLNIIYSNQCPWVARSIKELSEVAKDHSLELKITELKTAKEAQSAPSVYSTFSLIYNKKLLVDHYISKARFKNIIKKEINK